MAGGVSPVCMECCQASATYRCNNMEAIWGRQPVRCRLGSSILFGDRAGFAALSFLTRARTELLWLWTAAVLISSSAAAVAVNLC